MTERPSLFSVLKYECDCLVTFTCGHTGLMRKGSRFRVCDLCEKGHPQHVRKVDSE